MRLQAFREMVLRPTRQGRALIGAYEFLSPPLARWIGRRAAARFLTRRLVIRPARRLADALMRIGRRLPRQRGG